MLHKLSHYAQKSMRIGLRNVITICYLRTRAACMQQVWRSRVRRGKQYHQPFNMHTKRNLSFLPLLGDISISSDSIIAQADAYRRKEFSFLGAAVQRYETIPWHTDVRLQQQDAYADVLFDTTSFYADISIGQCAGDIITKDIKVPWELSRFQYLYLLGRAYEFTKQECYAQTFCEYVTDWLDNNRYLCGINWLCPMEVAIRAINWIVAWEFFKHAPSIPAEFYQRFVASLYDQMIYLENNWEYYDARTNNHYLSNLVGYLYLCWFFGDLPGVDKKRAWVVEEIMRESKKQVCVDGTSYEGSTAYHALVTELLSHAYLVLQEMHIPIPEDFCKMVLRMIDFIDRCKIHDAYMVTIGDNDSGKIVHHGLTQPMIMHMQAQNKARMNTHNSSAYFPHFGLSVVKNDLWHVTLRHHAYNALQPSGHFHNDVGSITLAVKGIPVIIDPGSFVYTPSVAWRNYFRSVTVHNTNYILGVEPVACTQDLFTLHMPERYVEEAPCVQENVILLHAQQTMYERFGVHQIRQVKIDDMMVEISDRWMMMGDMSNNLTACWNFTLAADISVHHEDNDLILMHHQIPLLRICSEGLSFTQHDVWFSPAYGSKEVTRCLRASRVMDDQPVVIRLCAIRS